MTEPSRARPRAGSGRTPGVARGRLLAAGLALVLAPGCAEAPAAPTAVVLELERLAFVPPGSSSPWVLPQDVRVGVDAPLLVDRFELRRRDVLELGLGLPVARGWADDHGAWDGTAGDLPACADWSEARDLASRRGMRLPTPSEWLYVAAGRIGHRYPWGRIPQRSVANTLELDLLRPSPVGAFESGRGPFGTYDQIGNVWEWVDGRVEGIGPLDLAGAELADGAAAAGDLRSVLGGSYLSRTRPLWDVRREVTEPLVFYAQTLDPAHRAPDVGLRCVADAETWLWTAGVAAPVLEPDQAERVRRVGAGWVETGEAALVELLEDLAGRDGAPPLVGLLLEGARR